MIESSAEVHWSDQELVAAARDGDRAAFAILFERHDARLRGSLTHLTGDPEWAADLAQDAFAEAFAHLASIREEASFAAWLYRIARNRLRSHQRRQALLRLVSLDWLPAGIEALIPALQRPDDSQAWHAHNDLRTALDALNPSLREALVLNRESGFSNTEIAVMLRITPEAAQKRIARAAREFARHYKEVHDA